MPFWPPETPLNRIERAFQRAGDDMIIGGDYTVRPFNWVVWVGEEEIVCAPDVEQLAEVAAKWVEERRADSE
jgi:hypothetical protein